MPMWAFAYHVACNIRLIFGITKSVNVDLLIKAFFFYFFIFF
jgi:hypothetical protein